MKVINIGETNSVANTFMAQMRDIKIQKDPMRFRANLRRLGNIFAYEISKTLAYSEKEVVTPLGTAVVPTFDTPLVAATILRAGIPLHEGIIDVLDGCESAFIAAFRKYHRGDDYHIKIEYCTCPSLTGKTLILSDTMLATGSSMEIAWYKLQDQGGTPDYTHFVCPISSVYAIEFLQKKLPKNATLWTCAIDEELTSQSYIVPGLGDAGDLAYGAKI
ncbi:MAG: uracil phosphoribosyltransferase [Bacteroidales bacterium]|nr:uracil phosphoribosyltransferase [Bacteroidales bacterium]